MTGGDLGQPVVVDLGVGDLVGFEGQEGCYLGCLEGYYLGCVEDFGWLAVGLPSVQPDQDVLGPS